MGKEESCKGKAIKIYSQWFLETATTWEVKVRPFRTEHERLNYWP